MSSRVMLICLLFCISTMAFADMQQSTAELVSQIGFDQRLNTQVPLDVPFYNEAGEQVLLKNYFEQHPVILLFSYYTCKNLCNSVLESLIRTMNDINLQSGSDYQVISISINPNESPEDARTRKLKFHSRYAGSNDESGWHLLTGQEDNIKRLADAVGFRYAYDPVRKEYLHASGIILLTAEGLTSKYFYGVGYRGRDVRLGLVDASRNQIGTAVDQLLLRCFHYDPKTGKYSLAIVNTLRFMGGFTFFAIAGAITFMLIRERNVLKSEKSDS